MKVIRIVGVLLIIGALSVDMYADNQMADLKSVYDDSMVKKLLESIPVEPFVHADRHYGDAKFYPIGISQNGRLAYLSYLTNPQYIQWDFVIFDLLQDAVLRQRSSEPHDEATSPLQFFQVAGITRDLKEYGIYLSESVLKPQPFPLQYDNDVYTAELKEKASDGDDYGMYTRHTIHLSSSNRGSKRLSEITDSFYSDPVVEGYLLSPFEHRIVVVVRYKAAYVEGETAGLFILTGGHLLVGFKQ